ncbi:MAG: hypothetical protein R6X20_13925, partial [Phycisphaerae bacterium]
AMPAGAAVTLTDGQAVPGLEPVPGEGLLRPEPSNADGPAREWFWYKVSARGLVEEPSEPTALAVADLAELIATEFQVASLPADDAVTVSETATLIQASGVGRPGGRAAESWPAEVPDWADPGRIGMRVGRAGAAPRISQSAASSLPGDGPAKEWMVRRRRA